MLTLCSPFRLLKHLTALTVLQDYVSYCKFYYIYLNVHVKLYSHKITLLAN